MPTITITIDDTHDSYALYGELIVRYGRDAADFDLNGGDYVEADPTPPHGISLTPLSDIMRVIDCPRPGCPGRPGQWCGTPKYSYGPHFMHVDRKIAAAL